MPDHKLILGRRWLWFCVLAAALTVLVAVATLEWLGPLPPRIVVMSTGAPGSDYELFAARYRAILKRSGIELRLIPSAGGVENLKRLNDPKSGVSVAFAQGGLTSEVSSPNLTSLGVMFFQPFWLFSRVPIGLHLEGLRGKAVSIGQEGSGTRAFTLKVMAQDGIDKQISQTRSLSPEEAGEALLRGDIDAATFVASWDSPVIRKVLGSSDMEVLSFHRADAYVALSPYLTKLKLPAGVGNMATNRPPADVELIAPKASVIVRRDLHPAIAYLLLEAATEIHSEPNIFQQFGRFPAAERGDLALAANAQQFYKAGKPFLQRYLPFWLSVFVNRLFLLLIPLVGIVYPVMRLAPALYYWSSRRQIGPLYHELISIEKNLKERGGVAASDVLAQLKLWDERAQRLHVPVQYVPILYSLRTHIALLLNRETQQSNSGVFVGKNLS